MSTHSSCAYKYMYYHAHKYTYLYAQKGRVDIVPNLAYFVTNFANCLQCGAVAIFRVANAV